MDIMQLRYFVSVADLRSFSETAHEFCISQSSVSKKIMALEDELGAKLFERTAKKVVLTMVGQNFYEHAIKMLDTYDAMQDDIGNMVCGRKESITLYTIPVLSHYKIIDWIIQFQMKYPNISVNIYENESVQIFSALQQRKVDFGIVRSNYLDKESYVQWPLVQDELAIVVSKEHPLADRGWVSLTECRNEKFILPNLAADLYNISMEACKKAGFRPKLFCYLNGRPEYTMKIIEKGLAVSLMMKKLAKNIEGFGVKTVSIEETVKSTTALVTSKNRSLSVKDKNFIRMLQKVSKIS